MRDIKLSITNNEELETVLPLDRVITVDNFNVVYLADTQFIINEEDIREVINEW